MTCTANRATNTLTTTTPTNVSSRIGVFATHSVTGNGRQRTSVRENHRLLEISSRTQLTFTPITPGQYPPVMRLDTDPKQRCSPELSPRTSTMAANASPTTLQFTSDPLRISPNTTRLEPRREGVPTAASNRENGRQQLAADDELWEGYLSMLREQARRLEGVSLSSVVQHPAYRHILEPGDGADDPTQPIDPRCNSSNPEDPQSGQEPPKRFKKKMRRKKKIEISSSESDDVETSSSDSSDHSYSSSDADVKSNAGLRCVKAFQNWNLKFSGDPRDARRFLKRLRNCKRASVMSDRGLLRALPCILTGDAGAWFDSKRTDLHSWRDFKKSFKRQYLTKRDDADTWEDLRKRTQGKGERITQYLSCFRMIVGHLKSSPSGKEQVKLAYRGLRSDYRHFMAGKKPRSLSELERLGEVWEREKRLDEKYLPPPSRDKMNVPNAAYVPTGAPRVAAMKEESSSESESSDDSVESEDDSANKETNACLEQLEPPTGNGLRGGMNGLLLSHPSQSIQL